ncbi:BQ2448_6203 [Microbotryum intermedium]|uniref:BQ2448_6203 protein n=1 Tax=Microbotryum intermedium TaxID=269621 RepID=A0A238FP41_9BASI|nr:BQ2448_6203 [Microbotryum intermedium]
MVRCKVIEIRWHDMTPIFSADFHQLSPDRHRKPMHGYAHTTASSSEAFTAAQGEVAPAGSGPEQTRTSGGEKMWRLATCGGDKHVRTLSLVASSPKPIVVASTEALEPSVEHLATLRKHTAAVNVVRFNPKGEMLASASDDGNIIFWVPGVPTKMIGDTEEDAVFEREQWRAASYGRTPTGQEIYDLCFSPNGAHVAVGSIDHTVYFFDVAQGNLLHKIAEHSGFVQGVAWDPRNQFIATQSSDRSMHVYSVAKAGDRLSIHPVSKNTKMEVQYSHCSSWASEFCPLSSGTEKCQVTGALEAVGEPSDEASDRADKSKHARKHSHTSSDVSDATYSMPTHSPSAARSNHGPPGSATSLHVQDQPEERSFTPMDPPHLPTGRPLSRRSSSSSHPIRSPSPAPLPATRVPSSPTMATAILHSPASSSAPSGTQSNGGSGRARAETLRLYTDANATFYFRRLAWSPDGSLLLTPAGVFEPPSDSASTVDQLPRNPIPSSSTASIKRKANENEGTFTNAPGPRPTVYLYTRSNITRPPIAHLPGHRTTSIAVRFCPVLWKLRTHGEPASRQGVHVKRQEEVNEPCVVIDLRRGETVCADLGGSSAESTTSKPEGGDDHDDDCVVIEPQLSHSLEDRRKSLQTSTSADIPSPDGVVSLFDLPYRMVYAIATMDCVYLYDTQQASPIAMFANLHYAPFTDLAWSPDGRTLVLSAEDGYCTVVAFDEHELGTAHDMNSAHELPALSAAVSAFDGPIAVQPASGSATFTSTSPAFVAMTAVTAPLEAAGDKRAATNEAGHISPNEPSKKKKAVLVHHGPLGSLATG